MPFYYLFRVLIRRHPFRRESWAVVVGVNDEDMFHAAVHLVRIKGGLCAVDDGKVLADLPLSIAGLMSDLPAAEVAARLQSLRARAGS